MLTLIKILLHLIGSIVVANHKSVEIEVFRPLSIIHIKNNNWSITNLEITKHAYFRNIFKDSKSMVLW